MAVARSSGLASARAAAHRQTRGGSSITERRDRRLIGSGYFLSLFNLHRRALFERDDVVVYLVDDVEGALQVRIGVFREDHSRESELALVAQRALILRNADLDLLVADVSEVAVAELLGVVDDVSGRYVNYDAVLLGPGVKEINVVLARVGREERANALLEEARLQEEPLASPFGVALHAHLV